MKMTIFIALILSILAFAGCQSSATETKTETKMETIQTQKEIAQISVPGREKID